MRDEGPSNSDATKGKGVGDEDPPPPGVSTKVLEELEERLIALELLIVCVHCNL